VSRSESERQSALNRDGRKCQICGSDEGLEVHHIIPLGMGGSVDRDVAENMITLCAECHGMVHAGMLHIEQWIPLPDKSLPIDARGTSDGDILKGLVPQRAELCVTDGESRPLSNDKLWFYQRQEAEALESEIEMVRQVQLVESKHAAIMAHIWRTYALISDAKSAEQFVAGLGLDSNKARDEARAAQWIEDNGLTWPDGANVRKVLLIASTQSANPGGWLDRAVDASYSDLRKELIAEGLKVATMRWYLLIGEHKRPLGRVQTDTLFVRSRDYEIVMNRIGDGVKVVEVNAFKAGIRWDRKAQKLYDRTGNEISFETWEKEA